MAITTVRGPAAVTNTTPDTAEWGMVTRSVGTVALSTTDAAQVGSVTETAPTTDTASSGLNGRLQRIAQRLPTLAVVPLTPLLDTVQYADGDILFDTIVMASSFLSTTGVNRLDSVHVLDEDDQGVAFDLVFVNALTSLGTFNVAPNISDANARNILGFCSVASGDYIDLGGCRIATVRNIGLDLTTGATNLWVAGITRGGTPTYTASGIKLKFGFTQSQI
jgi:hypothetical protein